MNKRVSFSLILVAVILALSVCAVWLARPRSGGPSEITAPEKEYFSPAEMVSALDSRDGYAIRACVLYCGDAPGNSRNITMDYLKQSLAVNLEAEAVDTQGAYSLAPFDLVYLDESLLNSAGWEEIAADIVSYTAGGGSVFLTNAFWDRFPADFLGATDFIKLDGFPQELVCPEVREDLTEIQELVRDFHSVYTSYADAAALMVRDYGYGMVCGTAESLVEYNGVSLYALNEYGAGCVLFTNPLLPNAYSKAAFSLETTDGDQTSYSNTTASCNQMLLNDYAAYVSKRIYGFSLERVFGSYGSPAMCWELHYEDIEAFAHNSIGEFSQLCEEALQIPSVTLVRNTYTWFEQAETMSYALNQSADGSLAFQMDLYENAYSSGTHIASGGVWLKLNALQNCGSYFEDDTSENYRLYPCVLDYDGDGDPDAFCGSSDGKVYYYHGEGFTGSDGRMCMSEAQPVSGVEVSGFSAPALADLDGDGQLDMVVGCWDGNLYWYRGTGPLQFQPQGVLLHTDIRYQVLPNFGDIDGDGVTDLAVGSNDGILLFYYGSKNGAATEFSTKNMGAMSRQCADEGFGFWLAPYLVDYDKNGTTDLLIGTYDGYVALLSGDGTGRFSFEGYITVDEMNYKGNNNLKFGCFCSPVLYDLDGNGSLDLICGYEEYGMAYPIDCDYFPFRSQLQSQVDEMLARNYYIGVHFLTNTYASSQREQYELSSHLAALRSYGIEKPRGANQHTWHMSGFDEAQSLSSIYRAGLLWESGYAPSGASSQAPQVNAENTMMLPFYLMDGDDRTLLIQNCSVLLYGSEAWTDLSGKYGIPVLVYYHCDKIYESENSRNSSAAAVATVAAFQEKFSYNFVREDQLMYGIAAAYNLAVDVSAQGGGFTVSPGVCATDFALYNETAQNACGVKLTLSDAVRETAVIDANVWRQDGRSYLIGLDRPVSVSLGAPEAADASGSNHIMQVNIPAEITATGEGASLSFPDGGMMQVVVSGAAETNDPGWTVTERNGNTVFTKFGDAGSLEFRYTKESLT